MRVLLLSAALLIAVPALAADAPASRPGGQAANCPQTSSYQAEQIGSYRGKKLEPRKLNQLPDATGYMAVYRRIGGCEAPMTMVEYRNPRRR